LCTAQNHSWSPDSFVVCLSISSGGNLLYIPVERETLFRVSLKEQTAQATADVKRDAKAVAAGISEGWSRDKQLDLNAATKDQLLSLPGVTAAEADRVIAGRPYSETGDLVTRRIMPKTEYDEIANRLTAKK
jgi:DNA uptake protein ComE-like DNA-binding protein